MNKQSVKRLSALIAALLWFLAATFSHAEEFDFTGGSAILPQEDEFLKVDEAFVLSTWVEDGRVVARWDMPDGYYLYRHQFGFESQDVVLGEAEIPPGKAKFDEYFGDVEVYYRDAEARVPIQDANLTTTGQVSIKYQGCADAGLCYPPETKQFVLKDGGIIPASFVKTGSAAVTADATPGAQVEQAQAAPSVGGGESEGQLLAGILADDSLFYALGLFFLAGIGLAFTPCVLPMVPILSSIIVGEGEGISQKRAFSLSLAYVLGMAFTYAFVGTLVGLFGAELNLQAALQSAPVLIFFSIVFVLLSLSMFGFYELQLPQSWQNALNSMSQKQEGGKHLSVLVMGVLSSLVVSPCVSAPLAGALIYISTTNDVVLGGSALLALGLGMGVPLMAVGASGGQWLPRAGAWMNNVKAVFGVLLLGVAIWLLERVIPPAATLALWAALLLGCGVYLGVLDSSPRQGMAQLGKATGAIGFVWGILLLIGAGLGAQDPLKPLAPLAFAGSAGGTTATVQQKIQWQPVKSLADVQAAARASNKPVLLDLYADWCISCKAMERNVFPQPAITARMNEFLLLKADVTDNDPVDVELMEHYGLFGPPSMVFLTEDGRELEEVRLQGEVDAEALERHLDIVLNLVDPSNFGDIAANM